MEKVSQVIIKILIIVILIQFISAPISHAGFWGDIFQAGDQFLEVGKESNSLNVVNGEKVKVEFNKIYNILFALGVVLTVIIGAVLGIKFMFGTIEEKAKVKETLFPYVTGCIVIFGAFGIWKVLVTLLSKI